MKIYWTIKSIPELTGLSPTERKARWNAFAARVRWRPLNWLAALPRAVLAAGITLIGAYWGWARSLGRLGGLAYSQF